MWCICVCTHICVYIGVSLEASEGGWQSLLPSALFSWDNASHWTWACFLAKLTSEYPSMEETTLLCWLFMWVLGFNRRASCLWKLIYPLSHFPDACSTALSQLPLVEQLIQGNKANKWGDEVLILAYVTPMPVTSDTVLCYPHAAFNDRLSILY